MWQKESGSRVNQARKLHRNCTSQRNRQLRSWICVCTSWSVWKSRHFRQIMQKQWRTLPFMKISWIIMILWQKWSWKNWIRSRKNTVRNAAQWSRMQKKLSMRKRRWKKWKSHSLWIASDICGPLISLHMREIKKLPMQRTNMCLTVWIQIRSVSLQIMERCTVSRWQIFRWFVSGIRGHRQIIWAIMTVHRNVCSM